MLARVPSSPGSPLTPPQGGEVTAQGERKLIPTLAFAGLGEGGGGGVFPALGEELLLSNHFLLVLKSKKLKYS